ncbi:MAG: 3'-5' exonuclease domain-containing protein 2 [Rhodoferax sp.]|nr:3'-5' exonuclease domain-containing protein 2 [Rhodoferax sp.]
MERFETPSREQIALLEPFERLAIEQITLVADAARAELALAALAAVAVLGFDTESKPTFARHEVSDGPHVVQLATAQQAWVFQLSDARCRAVVAQLLSSTAITKVGFGLGDDRRRIISKLGVEPAAVLDLNTAFWRDGYRRDIGVKGAVAVVFNRRFIKSRKATTSNWANPRLTESQLVYAANDAYAALRVHAAMEPAG